MAVKVFFCYAREDEALLTILKAHLQPLQRLGLIDLWHDRNISAGSNWKKEIDEHINTAQIILILVSPDFMASDYCYSREMQKALERYKRGQARVIPIILRHTYWQETPLGELQALPKDGRPIKSWPDKDEAFVSVTKGVRTAVLEIKENDSIQPQSRSSLEDQLQQSEQLSIGIQPVQSQQPRTTPTAPTSHRNVMQWLKLTPMLRGLLLGAIIFSSLAAFFFLRSYSGVTGERKPTPTPSITSSTTSTTNLISSSPTAPPRGLESSYFSGYLVSENELTGLKAQWNIPNFTNTGAPNEQVSIGMHVGCWSSNSADCLRLFILISFSNTFATIKAIYYSPQTPSTVQGDFALKTISPGDLIAASMEYSNTGQWILQIRDQTQGGQSAQASFGYPLSRLTAGFYVGTSYDPQHNRQYPLPNFSTITFQNVQLRFNAGWRGISALANNSFDMIQKGITFLNASSLHEDSFTVNRLNPQDQPTT